MRYSVALGQSRRSQLGRTDVRTTELRVEAEAGDGQTFRLDDLEPGTDYEIEVAAWNEKGCPSPRHGRAHSIAHSITLGQCFAT